MKMLEVAKMLFCGVIMFMCLGGRCQADVIVGLPAQANNGNCAPFGCPGGAEIPAFQQVYSKSAFAGPIEIIGINYFNTQFIVPGASTANGNFNLSFSYSNLEPYNLYLTDLDFNIGSASQDFFSGSLPGLSEGKLQISGTPFSYDPSQGNLLLTIKITGASDNTIPIYFDTGLSYLTSRAVSVGMLGRIVGGPGLVTEFVTAESATVPEPSTLALLGIGLVSRLGTSIEIVALTPV